MMIVLAWIVAAHFALGGALGAVFCRYLMGLSEAEAKKIRRNGKFLGESEYMKEFRATRAEDDYEAEKKWRNWFRFITVLGVLALALLLVHACRHSH